MIKNIKICGVKDLEIANAVVSSGATHIGFIFFDKSPRFITPAKASEIATSIRGKIKIVAVVVDLSDEFLSQINSTLAPDYIQLHGSESPERAKEIKTKFGKKIIKAISVSDKADIKKADAYKDIAEYILFDAKPPKDSVMPGGNAVSFDWNILKSFKPDYEWILSGGLNSSNIGQAIKITQASFVDISSGVETEPGKKDAAKIDEFMKKLLHK